MNTSFSHPWFLVVTEGGYVNHFGRVTSFSMFVNDSPGSSSGTVYTTDHTPLPQPTIEGGPVPVTSWTPREAPVPVAFGRFGAVTGPEGNRIQLDMAPDSDASSARVYRGASAEFKDRAPLPQALLPVSGSRFEYLDRAVEAGTTYWYWVEVVDRQGHSFLAGPVPATPPVAGTA